MLTMPIHFFKKLLHDDLMVVRIHCERAIRTCWTHHVLPDPQALWTRANAFGGALRHVSKMNCRGWGVGRQFQPWTEIPHLHIITALPLYTVSRGEPTIEEWLDAAWAGTKNPHHLPRDLDPGYVIDGPNEERGRGHGAAFGYLTRDKGKQHRIPEGFRDPSWRMSGVWGLKEDMVAWPMEPDVRYDIRRTARKVFPAPPDAHPDRATTGGPRDR